MSTHGHCGAIQHLACSCHWMHSGTQQQGRGKLSRAAFDAMPTLDVRETL